MASTDVDPLEHAANPPRRGAPLVATPLRLLAIIAVEAAVVVGGTYAFLTFTHSKKTLADYAGWLGIAAVVLAVVVMGMLWSEEARLQRALRTARTSTALIRGLVLARQQKLPFLLRLLSTNLGRAAVLVADGDRGGALAALSGASPLMQGGRLDRLKEIIEADLARATGTVPSLERAIATLRAASPLGNREADLYRTHVLVKAVLQLGDTETAVALIDELSRSEHEDERLYAVWLRVWFDRDEALAPDASPAERAAAEGELRLAAVLARSCGAEDLVVKLDERIADLSRAEAAEKPSPSA